MNPPIRPRLSVEPLEAREVPAAYQTLPVLDLGNAAVLDNARAIAAGGQRLGRRADVFLKIGDSNSADPAYLTALGSPGYNPVGSGLAAHRPDLLDTLATYRVPVDGSGYNSFNQPRRIVFGGGYLPTLMPHLDGEIRATNAGVALIMAGTNDATITRNPELYRAGLTTLVIRLTAAGIVPILSTVPDITLYNGAYQGDVAAVNQVIADVGEKYRVPVWNLWRHLSTLPGRGLLSDQLHLNSAAGGGRFIGTDLLFAQNARNLQALELLDWFHERVVGGGPVGVAASGDWESLAGRTVYAVGRDVGQGPAVTVYDATTGREVNRFLAFEPGFGGGVRVAVGDVTGDGVADVVAGAGAGGGPVVRVFDGTNGSLAASFYAYEEAFRGGVGSLAVADLDGDGAAEIVVGAGNGGGPVVATFRGRDFAEVGRFLAYGETFRGGVNVAAGTVAGVGPAVVTGPGVGGGPVVQVFAYGAVTPARSFFALDPGMAGGLSVAAGDLDGDGLAEIAAAPAAGPPRVQVFDADGNARSSFFAGPDDPSNGVRLAIRDGRLLVGNAAGVSVGVRIYLGLSADEAGVAADDPRRAYGIFVG